MPTCSRCPRPIRSDSITGLCRKCYDVDRKAVPVPAPTPDERLRFDREHQKLRGELAAAKLQYTAALREIERLQVKDQVGSLLADSREPYIIESQRAGGSNEATPIIVASDWHCEETIDPGTVDGLNEFNLEIAEQRIQRFARASLRLVNMFAQDIHIETVVLALLGDFITNDIHEELKDLTALQPVHALVLAQNHLISVIEYLLANSTYNFVIPCHSGNHARTTHRTHFSAENGHSLEYLLYLHLAAYFKSETRVTFQIASGYHSFLTVYGKTLRFHHGHAVKYGGGVGGLTIPANKAIAQWNQARKVDLDVFGHFHQKFDGGTFVSNGSLIGYNGFAVAIKAAYEQPQQVLFLMDKKRGKTGVWPILVG